MLYYVHDPMCSWCWGFRPVWTEICKQLPPTAGIRYVLGGLAPDTDAPMPEHMRNTIQATWQRIEREIPGTSFNHAFWSDCEPRRSTYPACRAVIAARQQCNDADRSMLLAIQRAYYLHGRNPSNDAVLISLAQDIGLNVERFTGSLNSTETRSRLSEELQLRDRLGVSSFPELVLETGGELHGIKLDYLHASTVIAQLYALLGP